MESIRARGRPVRRVQRAKRGSASVGGVRSHSHNRLRLGHGRAIRRDPLALLGHKQSNRTTGAVVMGRRAYAMGDPDSYVNNYEYQVPIFVLTHAVPERLPKQSESLTFTFVTDGIESAIRQARVAAGDMNITVVGGASTFQQCINAGLVDELHIDIKPLLLGEGLRLFEHLDPEPIELEITSVIESPDVTHLRFRIVKGN